ncbi:MAG: hypothetical protein IJ740_12475 [Ruminococcus sp.]|nr:hypothetical protein [Ruminococcus sp.]
MKQKFDSNALDDLIRMASKTLGTTPEKLKAQIDDGTLERSIMKMGGSSGKILQNAMKDPKSAEKYLKDPNAKSIYRKLGGK